jgi:Zn-dependent peptidase ImmA (M78 family)
MAATVYKAPINPEILRWARESIFVDVEKAAKTASVKTEIYKKWEHGEDFPTISRLRKLSNLFKRPLPVFFMPNIPQTPPMPRDFRKPVTGLEHPLTKDSLLAVRKARWYQSTAAALMADLGKPIIPIKKYDFNNKHIEQSIAEIRTLDIDTQFSWETNWEALKNWRQYLENLGIFIFQISMPLDEIRGFSLIRENCPPAIVINSKDSPNGRIFTLFHEYRHVLLNEAGICIPEEIEFQDEKHNETEQFCNEFAGNFLVPREPLNKLINESGHSDIIDLVNDLSRRFVVSNFVILRRLYSLGEIDYKSYRRFFKEFQKRIKVFDSSGGDFFKNKFAEKGSKFISLVVEAESGNTITTSKALEYLGIKLKHYNRLVDMLFQ